MTPMSQRILYLVRHGQTDSETEPPDALGNGLTALGRKQARLAARRLSSLPIAVIHHSTLRRAAETADIIAAKFPGVPLRPARLLWECVPSVPAGFEAVFAHVPPEEIRRDRRRAARAFAKYFKRARGGDRHEIVVCHGNLIRYFVCCALQAPPEIWANADVHHCGFSVIVINPDGRVRLVSHNDTGHLPRPMQTFV